MLAREDGYFVARYISETVSLEIEATLVAQLATATAKQQRSLTGTLAASATAAADAARTALGLPPQAGTHAAIRVPEDIWRPGYSAAISYGSMLTTGQRALMQEGALFPAVGAAAAKLASVVREAVQALADVHQLRHAVELSDLRREVLVAAAAEMGMLLREEALR